MFSEDPTSISFIDTIFCMLVIFTLVFVLANNNSMPIPETYPIVNLFIQKSEKDNEYTTMMNSFEMNNIEIKQEIAKAKQRGVKAVQVKAAIDEDTPYKYFSKIKSSILSLSSRKKGTEFVVIWKDDKLSKKHKKTEVNHEKAD